MHTLFWSAAVASASRSFALVTLPKNVKMQPAPMQYDLANSRRLVTSSSPGFSLAQMAFFSFFFLEGRSARLLQISGRFPHTRFQGGDE